MTKLSIQWLKGNVPPEILDTISDLGEAFSVVTVFLIRRNGEEFLDNQLILEAK